MPKPSCVRLFSEFWTFFFVLYYLFLVYQDVCASPIWNLHMQEMSQDDVVWAYGKIPYYIM
jgi:hypothetical protein